MPDKGKSKGGPKKATTVKGKDKNKEKKKK